MNNEQLSVSLRDFMEARFDAQEEAVRKAETAMTIRLEHLNEFRKQMDQMLATFITKDYFDAKFDAIDNRLKALETFKAAAAVKFAVIAALGAGVVSLIVTLLTNAFAR